MRIDFDHNATTPCAPEVVEAMLPWFTAHGANPSSTHAGGEEAADALRAARSSVARLVGVSPRELVFTSGGTEAIATAIDAALRARPERQRVVATSVEHAAVLENLRASGRELALLDVDVDGAPRPDAALAALDERCALLCVQWANNELGTLPELRAITARARELGVLVLVDAVQAAGKVPIELAGAAAPHADYAALSAHKLCGPKGAGALWLRAGAPFAPRQRGGAQEGGRRAGTENLPALVGFGRAAELARTWLAGSGPEAQAALRDRFEAGLAERAGPLRFHARGDRRLPNTSNVAFEGVEAEALLAWLSSAGLLASAGSACHAGARRPSHVLEAIGLADAEARSTVRFSLGRGATAAEVETAVELVAGAVHALRQA
ncbi:MAG: aminotransferase class V-fold PLP-dependent enzyme [Planctomycetes bacterium]|nr:aminotransferase class V-fold PLP-dependent enzyme [Planctomycetota bacterium]